MGQKYGRREGKREGRNEPSEPDHVVGGGQTRTDGEERGGSGGWGRGRGPPLRGCHQSL